MVVSFRDYPFQNGSGSVSPWTLLWVCLGLPGVLTAFGSSWIDSPSQYTSSPFILPSVERDWLVSTFGSFWRVFQEELGTHIDLSTKFHPQTNGQSECTIQVLEDMLQACVMDFGGQWDHFLPLAEFVYNIYQTSIQIPCSRPYMVGIVALWLVGWFESTETRPHGTDLLQEALNHVKVIQDRLRTAQSRHQSYVDCRCRPLRFAVGDRVFLRVSPMKGVMRFGRRGNLSPR
ncbi:hypothetical protein KY290_010835 [Solanum tuberosum]|uniref:Integrase catalytic domain-containing protein n=1 Tax=Solanum tuberosum TaxID=4113 RepID=A0ABQ7W0X0_SOLTU|nr:hypothetical protein KY290_010835 [Solanum tuberosum]